MVRRACGHTPRCSSEHFDCGQCVEAVVECARCEGVFFCTGCGVNAMTCVVIKAAPPRKRRARRAVGRRICDFWPVQSRP